MSQYETPGRGCEGRRSEPSLKRRPSRKNVLFRKAATASASVCTHFDEDSQQRGDREQVLGNLLPGGQRRREDAPASSSCDGTAEPGCPARDVDECGWPCWRTDFLFPSASSFYFSRSALAFSQRTIRRQRPPRTRHSLRGYVSSKPVFSSSSKALPRQTGPSSKAIKIWIDPER